MAMPAITIGRVGLHKEGAVNIKIGRGTDLGNPFRLYDGFTRDQACDKFAPWFLQSYQTGGPVRSAVSRIVMELQCGNPVNLQCWCTPKRCHGEDIRALVVRIYDGEKI